LFVYLFYFIIIYTTRVVKVINNYSEQGGAQYEMTAIIIECLLALMFLAAGLSLTLGSKAQVEGFKKFRLPQWFRVVTGLMQLIGVAALVIGFWDVSWAAWAGIWFGIMMLCAVAVHLRIKDPFGKLLPAIIVMILAVSVTLLHASELIPFT
jgi:uncharacterized membrane protein YphA (DoxX/SURF4 family)